MKQRLRIANSGPCAGHACDDCVGCSGGSCCGNDISPENLPEMGDVTVPSGELGRIDRRQESFTCHFCGKDLKSASSHLLAVHNMSADEYRALVGLNRSTPLCGVQTSETMRQYALSRPSFLASRTVLHPTSEQIATLRRLYPMRLETRIKQVQASCTDCGNAFLAAFRGTRSRFCPPCNARRAVARNALRYTSGRRMPVIARACATCGDAISGTPQIMFCPECRRLRMRAAERAYRERRKRRHRAADGT